jgi:predicted signal transduction protein with EAL and GGDEF domain
MLLSVAVTRNDEFFQLTQALPELVLAIHRDGTVLAHFGGRHVSGLEHRAPGQGSTLDDMWPPAAALSLKQLCRKAIASRRRVETTFVLAHVEYQALATATAPDRATCIIRPLELPNDGGAPVEPRPNESAVSVGRRRFLPQLQDAISSAALREASVAIVVIELAGMSEIREIDHTLAERVLECVLVRLSQTSFPIGVSSTDVGPISDFHLAIMIETADRKLIEALLSEIRNNISKPVRINQDTWQVSCYMGVALLGRDSNAPKELLDQARIAAGEARRSCALRPQFFTDTMRLKSLARLDVGRELFNSLGSHEIGMRYLGRYELSSGRLDALVGYVTWHHPMRGKVAPKEFLRVAEASGMAVALSREMMRILRVDVARLLPQTPAGVRFSFGPLRHHLLHDHFFRDIEEFFEESALSPDRLEIRVDERSFVAMPSHVFTELHRIGIRAVVDEVGRSMMSLAKLATLPLWGLQLDRVLVEDMQSGPVTLRLCQAGISTAAALGLSSIATGVDHELTRQLLLASGCSYGCGDLFETRGLAINLPEQNNSKIQIGGRP